MAPSEEKRRKWKHQNNENEDAANMTKSGKKKKKENKQNPSPEENNKVTVKKEKKMKGKAAEEPTDAAVENAPKAATGRKRSVISDPRFASVHSDPRFQRVPRHQSKVAIDSRFDRMFKDKSFAGFSAPVDKRGKARKGKKENPLLHYYIHQKEPVVGGKGSRLEELEVTDDEEEDEEEDVGGSESESSTSSSSDEEEEEDDDQGSMNSDVAHYLMANHDDTLQIEQPTSRLAAVNMDWDHIKAVDIYVVMTSCLPKDGHIVSVAVYPSNFGLECMEIESTKGPSVLIHGKKEQNSDEDDDDEEDDYDDENENEKLRIYELNRLRYYYAVVDCDSSTTAEHLYKNLDGTELLKTSNVLDLRFIPDSMEFTRPPRDITSKAPTSYTEPDFHTRALQHSIVKLTWEEEEPERKKTLRRKYTAEQLEKMDVENFLASEEEESDDEEMTEVSNGQAHKPNKGAKYLALLQPSDNSDAEDDGDQDMEITFNTGLEDIAKRVLEKKENKSETVWEAYLRKRREKKKARKNAKYSSGDDESDSDYQEAPEDPDQPDDFSVEETMESDCKFDKKGSKGSLLTTRKGLKDKKQPDVHNKKREASQAELELLCANSNRAESLPKEDTERAKKAKGKEGKKLPTEDKLPKEDYKDDPRFSALFNSHVFALDPTDPQFKRSATYARQMLQKQKRGAKNADERFPSEQAYLPPGDLPEEKSGDLHSGHGSSKKEKQQFMSLVKSLKRNAGAFKMERNSR